MRLLQHFELLQRKDRGLALRRAIQRTVRPGDRVLDAGAGTGLLSLWAAKAGAREVVGIDLENLDLAAALATANDCSQKLRLVRADLSRLDAAAIGDSFDVVLALLYHNDPRRDEAQSRLVGSLRERFLRPGGFLIPDQVRYQAFACEWPEQDLSRRRSAWVSQIADLEGHYELRLQPLLERLGEEPDAKLFPGRLPSGELAAEGRRPLSPAIAVCTIDYARASLDYPQRLCFPIDATGSASAVVWAQELVSQGEPVFANQSVSWLSPTTRVEPGQTLNVALDDRWRRTNQLSLVI